MKLFDSIFGKRYLGWDEYSVMIEDIDSKAFKKSVKENNEKIRKEIFKDTKFSG